MYRNTWMEVDLDAIAENVRVTKEICGKKYIAVLKGRCLWMRRSAGLQCSIGSRCRYAGSLFLR
jgi:hypothetical protein